MSQNFDYSWEASEVLDDAEFLDRDAEEFKNLVDSQSVDSKPNGLGVAPGTVLKGNIVDLSKDYVAVDVGLKSEGLVPISEFHDPSELKIGGEIEVLLEQSEDDKGQIVISRHKARKQRQWEYILEHCSEGSIVNGIVLRKVKGGLMVDIGVEAFLPGSQVDNKRVKELDSYVGKTFEFKILKINQERQNVVVSRRELIEAEMVQKRCELLNSIQEGEIRKGIVKNITDFGVFLDLEGIDVLLHITDMSWKRIRHPSEMVKIGDALEVIILSVDRDRGRVAVGLKQREKSPWEEIEDKYPVGSIVSGRVTNITSYGAFVEIEPGIEGLVHVSEMGWNVVVDPSKMVSRGGIREAVVLSVNKEEGKISLSFKQMEKNPWEDIETKYPVGSIVTAEVKSLTNYGAFVELEPGLEGLIHVSSFAGSKKLSRPSEVLKKGSPVECVILFVDKDSRKITLGIKDPDGDGCIGDGNQVSVGDVVIGKVTKITAFGVFLCLESGRTGLVHINDLSEKSFAKPEEIVSIEQIVRAKVTKIDVQSSNICLSLIGVSQEDLPEFECFEGFDDIEDEICDNCEEGSRCQED